MTNRALLLASVASICGSISGLNMTVHAQEDSEDTILDTVVVNAQRREQTLQDVPIAVAPVSKEDLVNNDVRSLQDLGAIATGLVSTNTVGYGQAPLTIRGIGGTNGGGNVFGDEPVAIYVDDVYIARPRFAVSDLLDIESIEVLRGPQGTFFGRNATAGAMLIRTAKPTFDTESFLRLSASTLDEYRAQGAVSGPLGDTVAGRVAVGYFKQNGWGRNTTTNEDVPRSEQTTIRGSLTWNATDSLSFDLTGDWYDQELHPALLRVFSLDNPAAIPAFDRRDDFWDDVEAERFDRNDPQFSEVESKGVTLSADWDLGDVALTSVTGWRDTTLNGATDTDGSPLQLTANQGHFEDSQISQELRLASVSNGSVDWIIGAYYMHEENAIEPFTFLLYQIPLIASVNSSQEVDAYALFADATIQLADAWSVALGGRYSYEEKTFQSTISGTGTGSWNDFSPRIVLQYKPSDTLFLYGSYSTAFKSGGFNALKTTPGSDRFDPEEVQAFEVGLKADWLDGHARTNISVFHYDYTDLQIRTTPGGNGGVVIENAASATSQGIEAETLWRPDNHWTFTANVAYLDATFDEGMISSVDLIIPPTTTSLRDVSGNRLSRAPEWQGYLAAKYELEAFGGTLAFDANYRFQEEVYFLEAFQDHDGYRGDAFGELGGRISYTSADDGFDLAVFGRNLTDEQYVTQVTQLGNLPHASISDPMRFGVQLTVRR